MDINVHDIAAKVTPELVKITGQDWRYIPQEEGHYWARIALGTGPDCPRIILQAGYNNHGKIHVSGDWPRGEHGAMYGPYRDRPEIGISGEKPPALIAKDIARRFLPEYLRLHAEAVAGKQRDADCKAKALVTAQALAGIVGEAVGENDNGYKIHKWRSENIGVDILVDRHTSDRRIKLTLDDLTQAEAERVLQAIQ